MGGFQSLSECRLSSPGNGKWPCRMEPLVGPLEYPPIPSDGRWRWRPRSYGGEKSEALAASRAEGPLFIGMGEKGRALLAHSRVSMAGSE